MLNFEAPSTFSESTGIRGKGLEIKAPRKGALRREIGTGGGNQIGRRDRSSVMSPLAR